MYAIYVIKLVSISTVEGTSFCYLFPDYRTKELRDKQEEHNYIYNIFVYTYMYIHIHLYPYAYIYTYTYKLEQIKFYLPIYY